MKRIHSVLIVDDNEMDRFLAREMMRRVPGFSHVMEVEDGEEAIALFSDVDAAVAKFGDAFPPRLIILDINMPRMNGFEFMHAFAPISATLRPPPVVVVMLTSSTSPEDRVRAEKGGLVAEFAEKPISTALLTSLLERFGEPSDHD